MQVSESLRIAVANLRVHKVRSFLTILGTVIGVMSVIAIVSIIEGMNKYVSERLLEEGSNTFYVDKVGLINDYQEYLNALKRKDLTMEDARALERLSPSILVVGSMAQSVSGVRYRSREASGVEVRGVDEGFQAANTVEVEYGRFLGREDVLRRRPVIVLGADISERLFPDVDPLGKEVRVGRYTFRVIGVAERKGSLLGRSQDSNVMIPLTSFQKSYGSRSPVMLVAKARDQQSLQLAQDEARSILRARRKVPFSKPDDFAIMSAETFMQIYKSFTSTAYLVTVGIAALSLVVGGIVIMNIMIVSVTERTKEIGIRKAVGARNGDILFQFLIEALILSGSGGLIGVLIGVGLAVLVSHVTPLPAAVKAWAIGTGLMVALGVGGFFGIYPAARAAKMDPIEALRYE